jgi:hypothetical protein
MRFHSSKGFLATGIGILMTAAALAQVGILPAYYFLEQKTCTILVDFQKERVDIERLNRDARLLRLVRDLVAEYAKDGPAKCVGADHVRMMAVFIPGVDSYGRPDFPNRINILRIEADPEKLLLAARQGLTDFNAVKSTLSVTTFDGK